MSDGISLFEIIKRGGYEASLITTFNATLPFYEEVVLRKLVSAGCRHNVVLMDRQQCALAWDSEASRPRLAGYAYTLLPVSVAGAFHPKVCLLLGPKKASIMIGSHNLTLTGFGYNREITNWIEVAGPKDGDGVAVLKATWQMVRQWIELEQATAPESLLQSALAIADFVNPLIANAGPMTSTIALAQIPGGPALIEQLAESVSANVKQIGVIGAFFDHDQHFIKALQARWPTAEVVVGIDPDTVQLAGNPDTTIVRYVDARPLWSDHRGYLHAKAVYLETDDAAADVFASGSANPSRPAWMTTTTGGNVEAVLLHRGTKARAIAESTGIRGMFALTALSSAVCASIAERSARSAGDHQAPSLPVWTGVADPDIGELRICCRGKVPMTTATLLGPNLERLEDIKSTQVIGNEIVLRPSIDLTPIRSCLIQHEDSPVARAMILHPSVLASASRSSRQSQIRSAFSLLGSSEGDISRVIASVERVIFADETTHEVNLVIRDHQDRRAKPHPVGGPESLAINVADLPKVKKKTRLLKSGDLACLLDILLRRLSEGLDMQRIETDKAGRTEEEQIGQEDNEPVDSEQGTQPATVLSDREIAMLVARRARTLTRKMVRQLNLAAHDETRQASAVIQLIAVLALLRELRHLDTQQRWRLTWQPLVEERDRRYLLDESIRYLLGPQTHLLDVIDQATGVTTEEAVQLRVLLLWLAWDLGEELTERINQLWNADERLTKLKANAVFLKLLPEVAVDEAACSDLKDSMAKTVKATPESAIRTAAWFERHQEFGIQWSNGFRESNELQLGGFCRIPGHLNEPYVIVELNHNTVGFWDYHEVRRFLRNRTVAVTAML